MDDLEKLIVDAERELEQHERELAPLLALVHRKRREVALLREAWATRRGSISTLTEPDVIASAISILRDAKKPMTLRELHDAFNRRAISLPGKGNTTNLLSYLRRSDEIARVGHGTYGLKEWGSKK